MKKYINLCCLTLSLAALSGTGKDVLAQTSMGYSGIFGIVIDSISREPLEFTTLKVLSSDKAAIKTGFTGPDGSFIFSGINPGHYSLVATTVGYQTKAVSFRLDVEGDTILNIGTLPLQPEIAGLKEIVVKGTKPVIRQEADRILYDIQADPDSKMINLLGMMRKVPYLSVDSDENILLKGSNSYRILINGKSSGMIEHNYKEVLRGMPASSIQRIEVITIPPANYEAEGLAGIINIITIKKIADSYSGSLSLSEGFPAGGPGIGGSLHTKLGKTSASVLFGGNKYSIPQTDQSFRRLTSGESVSSLLFDKTRQSNSSSGYAGIEVAYEVNPLNLISGHFNLNRNRSSERNTLDATAFDTDVISQYFMKGISKGKGSGTDLGFSYQKGFKADKNRLLTTSYKYYRNARDLGSDFTFENKKNAFNPDYQQDNRTGSSEQTFQIDYFHPSEKVTIESGIKSILRRNQSDYRHLSFDELTQGFELEPLFSNKFINKQTVLSAYNSYQFLLNSWSIKAGVRLEHTSTSIDFISTESEVRQRYLNLIPSVAVNRKIGESGNITLGYSKRIKRPGIQKLNPFIDRSNPAVESSGNPNLRPVLSNRFQLGYGTNGRVTLNVGIDYTFVKNIDQRIYTFDPDANITRASLANTGKATAIDQSVYVNFPINKQINISLNATGSYIKLQGEVSNELVENHWYVYYINLTNGYRLPNLWRINGSLNVVGPSIVSLQSSTNAMVSCSFSLSKELIKEKLSAAASVSNPFSKYRMNKVELTGRDFEEYSSSKDYFRAFSISLSYNFGKLKQVTRRSKRGIKNDDL